MICLYGHDAEVAKWTGTLIPHAGGNFGNFYSAIGVLDKDGVLVAGVVFTDYYERYRTIQVSCAASDPHWSSPGIVKEILSYVFLTLKVNRLWSVMPHDNTRAIEFNKGIGFRQEAVLKDVFGPDKHGVITRLMAKDFEKLYLKAEAKQAA